jgi:hypothetical protein
MDLDRLAYFLTLVTFVGGFAADPDPLRWHPNRADIVELKATEDGTALVTLKSDAGSFLGRVRPDGSYVWIQPIPGTVANFSLAANAGRIAVDSFVGRDFDVTAFSNDGHRLWIRKLATGTREDIEPNQTRSVFTEDTLLVWSLHDGGDYMTGLSISDGTVRWDERTVVEGKSGITTDGRTMVRNPHGDFFIDTNTGQLQKREGCVLGGDYLRTVSDHSIAGDHGWTGQLDFRTAPDARLDGCATYRDQIAVLIPDKDETKLVMFDRKGAVVRESPLPRLVSMRLEAFAGIPTEHLSFTGELPRYVPLVAQVDDEETQPILVDMETGGIVEHGPQGISVDVLRDGDAAYIRHDVETIQQFSMGAHPIAVLTPMVLGAVDHVGGGFFWTYSEYTVALDEPGIKATPTQPHQALDASR